MMHCLWETSEQRLKLSLLSTLTANRAKDLASNLLSSILICQVVHKWDYWVSIITTEQSFQCFPRHWKGGRRKEICGQCHLGENEELRFQNRHGIPPEITYKAHQRSQDLRLRNTKEKRREKVQLRITVGFQVVSYPLPSAEVGVCTTLVCCPGTGALALLIRRSNLVLLQVLEQTLSCW